VTGDRSISDQKNLDGLSPVRNAWMARDGWRFGIPWTCENFILDLVEPLMDLTDLFSQGIRCQTIGRRSRVQSEPDRRSDFAIKLASEPGKLRKLLRLGAVAAPPHAGPPNSGLLVTQFAGYRRGGRLVSCRMHELG
ncbi:hypothetical protein B296_00046724, partial [Ensete ventricosum]